MTIDIDDIEARITEAEAQSPAGFELLGIYLETEEARVLCAEVRELRDLLYSLLAVIHCDGGHYTGRHGVQKSARDAQQVVHADRAEIGETRALFSRWRDTLCLFPQLSTLVESIDEVLGEDTSRAG